MISKSLLKRLQPQKNLQKLIRSSFSQNIISESSENESLDQRDLRLLQQEMTTANLGLKEQLYFGNWENGRKTVLLGGYQKESFFQPAVISALSLDYWLYTLYQGDGTYQGLATLPIVGLAAGYWALRASIYNRLFFITKISVHQDGQHLDFEIQNSKEIRHITGVNVSQVVSGKQNVKIAQFFSEQEIPYQKVRENYKMLGDAKYFEIGIDLQYIFIVEWFDISASIIRTFYFTYFTLDNTIQLYDLKNKKIFLARIACPQVNLEDVYVGAVFTVFSRKLKVVDYADEFTRSKFLTKQKQKPMQKRTFAMIKPDALNNLGHILQIIQENNFQISNLRMAKLRPQDAQSFYAEHREKHFFNNLVSFISSDYVVGLELVGQQAIRNWRELIGPTNSEVARKEQPESIRGRFGTNGTQNACHGSDSEESAKRELEFFFGHNSQLKSTAVLQNCSCLIIKPHVIETKSVGKLIQQIIQSQIQISAMQMFFLDRATCDEFFEVYNGVLPEFNAISENTSKGPVIILEVHDENAVHKLRDLCGPHDPKIAQTLYPGTLRANFGIDRVKNAVHCTDLEEDGSIESQYFFSILQN